MFGERIKKLEGRVQGLEAALGTSNQPPLVCQDCGEPMPTTPDHPGCGGNCFVTEETYQVSEEPKPRTKGYRTVCSKCGLVRHKADTCPCRRCGGHDFCAPSHFRGVAETSVFIDAKPGRKKPPNLVLTYCPQCHGVQPWQRKTCRRCDVPVVTFRHVDELEREVIERHLRRLDEQARALDERAKALDTREASLNLTGDEIVQRRRMLDEREIRIKRTEESLVRSDTFRRHVVQGRAAEERAVSVATCGSCGRSWW